VALVLLYLMTGPAMAQESKVKVTSLMSKDLPESPGKEMLMITVEYAPGATDPVHRHNAHAMLYEDKGAPVLVPAG
jgi:quercetin dioxygenase-like cupin family protein